MAQYFKVTPEQEDVIVAAMLKVGISREKAEEAITETRRMLDKFPAPTSGPSSVTVRQEASVVEAGATIIGYRADRIG